MASIEQKSTAAPDETRQFPGGKYEVVNLTAGPVGKGTFEPGWRWSESLRQAAGTDTCQVPHLGYIISGRMRVQMDDGSEGEVGPGDIFAMPPGHDAWIVGGEPCVLLDFAGASHYAKT